MSRSFGRSVGLFLAGAVLFESSRMLARVSTRERTPSSAAIETKARSKASVSMTSGTSLPDEITRS